MFQVSTTLFEKKFFLFPASLPAASIWTDLLHFQTLVVLMVAGDIHPLTSCAFGWFWMARDTISSTSFCLFVGGVSAELWRIWRDGRGDAEPDRAAHGTAQETHSIRQGVLPIFIFIFKPRHIHILCCPPLLSCKYFVCLRSKST